MQGPPGHLPEPARAPTVSERAPYGLSTGSRSGENAGRIGSSQLSTPAPVRLVKNLPAPVKTVRAPAGRRRAPYENDKNVYFYSPYGPRE